MLCEIFLDVDDVNIMIILSVLYSAEISVDRSMLTTACPIYLTTRFFLTDKSVYFNMPMPDEASSSATHLQKNIMVQKPSIYKIIISTIME